MNRRASLLVLPRSAGSIDPRSLGLGRIALGLALLADLARRATELSLWYSNEGLLPNHTVLWQPVVRRLFSLFFTVSLPHEAALAFAACAICFAALTVGFRTRLVHALSLLAFISLRNRVIFLEGDGTVLLGALVLWTLFLPLSRRFSVDAVVASLRARPEHGPAQLDAAGWPARDVAPVTSLAVLALALQLASALALSCANRSGATWAAGTAAHYLLHQDRVVTALGVAVREQASPAVMAALTYVLRWAPALLAALVVVPLVWSRRAAIVVALALVVVQASLVRVGGWAVALLAYLPFFLSVRDWGALAARARRRDAARSRLVFFDGDCGICFQSVRLLRRLDPRGRLRLIANDDQAAFPPGFTVDAALLERTILVVDPASGRRWTRAQGFAEIFRVLPGGLLVTLLLRLPLLRTVAGGLYDRIAVNRTRISVWLGLSACGVPQRGPAAAAPAATKDPTPSRPPVAARRRAWARESLAAFVLLTLSLDGLAENPGAPAALRDLRPAVLATLVGYSGLSQDWTRWSPDPPLTDRMVVIDAVTADGRHLDPFNAAGSRVHDLPVTAIPARLGESTLLATYVARMPERDVYWGALQDWILRTPARTGRPGDRAADRIVGFDAWVIDDDSPPPGETAARATRTRLFLRHGGAP